MINVASLSFNRFEVIFNEAAYVSPFHQDAAAFLNKELYKQGIKGDKASNYIAFMLRSILWGSGYWWEKSDILNRQYYFSLII
ncbi:hypothetical protein M0802_000933 [Mischocyttarus mexicanus]|nr:hypothetical protein M0802_000933 [Mischocyttarus mexicanus]